ncbi:glycosyltransferase, partial [Aeromonas salmonicida]
MKVSVLVPVYNLARFIEPCLLGQQTDFEFEVIAIDDGSSDDSWSIMQRLARQWPGLRVLGVVAQISQQIMISPAPSDRYTRGFLTGRP